MIYKLDGKSISIPESVIEGFMKSLDISKQEAIEMWLDDEGYTQNIEQEQLTQKAKENNIVKKMTNAAAGKQCKKSQSERVKKDNPLKQNIIQAISECIQDKFPENSGFCIRNKEKYIDFSIDGVEFTINLVQHRAKK